MNHSENTNSKNTIQFHNSPLNINPTPKAVSVRTRKKKPKNKQGRSAVPPAIILIIGIICIL